jgi:hypothetical protein
MISITASRTHRRANRNFERGVAVEINPEDLTEEENLALLSDPELSIREVEAQAKTATAKKPEAPQLSAEERAEKLLSVIPELGEADTNKDGSLKVKAVSALAGFDVTKSEIEAAQAQLAQGSEGEGENTSAE